MVYDINVENIRREYLTIAYLPVHFYCAFDRETKVDTHPIFVLRSVLGAQLRSMTCMSTHSKCDNCMFNQACVYCRFFETVIDKSNPMLEGRDRASHPFAFTQNSRFKIDGTIKEFDFTITLFGDSIRFLPYIYAAFCNAGQRGLYSARSKFVINDVKVHDQSIMLSFDELDMNFDANVFELSENDVTSNDRIKHEIDVSLLSPLRFLTNGDYADSFTADEFFACLYRRLRIMLALYGVDYHLIDINQSVISVGLNNPHWEVIRYSRYSARQKHSMIFNGISGLFTLSGEFTPFMLKLLEFNKLANAGKNTNFGFGQIDYIVR